MEIKDGYKLTEIGVIPKDWEVKSLGECSVENPSYGIKAAAVKYDYNLPTYLRITDISEDGKFISKNKVSVDNFNSSDFYLSENDLVFARTGASVGKSYLYNSSDGKLVFAGFLIKVKVNPLILNATYLKYYVQTNEYWNWVKVMSMRSGQPGINGVEISQFKIPLPPLPEQKAIAEVLSDMDNLITGLERQIEKKRLVKQGAMQRLLTAGEDWEVRTLGEIGEFKNGINKSSDDFGFGFPFVNLMDVFGVNSINSEEKLGLVNSNNAERQMYELKKGDVLFIRSSVKPSGVGLTSLVERDLLNTVFSGFIIRFRDKGFLADEFKKYCFYSEDFRNRLIGSSTVSANTNINQEALKKLELAFPKSLQEQTRIATILSDMDKSIESMERELSKYRAVKVGLMKELLSGRKRLVRG